MGLWGYKVEVDPRMVRGWLERKDVTVGALVGWVYNWLVRKVDASCMLGRGRVRLAVERARSSAIDVSWSWHDCRCTGSATVRDWR